MLLAQEAIAHASILPPLELDAWPEFVADWRKPRTSTKTGPTRERSPNDQRLASQETLEQVRRAGNLFDMGRYDAAYKIVRSVLKLDPQSRLANRLEGFILINLGRSLDALAIADNEIDKSSLSEPTLDNVIMWLLRGEALLRLNRYSEALYTFSSIVGLLPQAVYPQMRVSFVLNAQDQYDDALKAADRALEIAPRFPMAHAVRSVALRGLKRNSDALEEADKAYSLSKLSVSVPEAYIFVAKGVALFMLERFSDALNVFSALVKYHEQPTAYALRSEVLNNLHRFSEALNDIDRSISMHGSSNAVPSRIYVIKGHSLCGLQQFSEALLCFDAAISVDIRNADAYIGRGKALFHLNKADEAAAAIEQGLILNPDNPSAYAGRAAALLHAARHEEAIIAARRALELKPNQAELHVILAVCFFQLKRLNEAIVEIEVADNLSPDHPNILETKRLLYLYVENEKRAAEAAAQLFENNTDVDVLITPEDNGTTFINDRENEDSLSVAIKELLIERGVPQAKWGETAKEIERAIRKALGPEQRPLWNDRSKTDPDTGQLLYPELAKLSAPEFLKRVWADQIAPDGSIESQTVTAFDAALMNQVSIYISMRKTRRRDSGHAAGLHVITGKVGRPKKPSLG